VTVTATPVTTTTGDFITVQEARDTMTGSLLAQAGPLTYTDAEKDRALRFAGNEFIRRTFCTRTTATFQINATTNEGPYDVPASISDFRPYRLLWVEESYRQLRVVDYSHIAQMHEDGTEGTGEPEWIAWRNKGEMFVAPTPDQAYTLTFTYAPPLVQWTIGGTDSVTQDTEINIAREYIDGMIRYGAVPAMVTSAPGVALRDGEWGRFYEFIEEVAGTVADDAQGIWLGDETDFIG